MLCNRDRSFFSYLDYDEEEKYDRDGEEEGYDCVSLGRNVRGLYTTVLAAAVFLDG